MLSLTWPGQPLENGLDLGITRVISVLEQHADIKSRRGRRADYPLPVDVRDQRRLTGLTGHRLGAQAGKSRVRDHGGGSGVPSAVRRVAFQPGLDGWITVSAG